MAIIPTYLNTSPSTPLQQGGEISSGAVAPAIQSVEQAGNDLVNQSMSRAEQANNQALGSRLQANEAAFQEQFKLPEIFNQVQSSRLQALQTLTTIDARAKEKQQHLVDTAYSLNESTKFQTELEEFKSNLSQQVPSDGKGYTEALKSWIDNRTQQMMKNAPSVNAGFDMLGLGSKEMIQGVREGTAFESKARIADANNKYESMMSSALNQITNNPASAEKVISEMGPKIALTGHALGLTQDKIDRIQQGFVSSAQVNRINSSIETGDLTGASSLLHDKDIISSIDPNKYTQMYDKYVSAERQYLNQHRSEVELASTKNALVAGHLNSGDKGYGKAYSSLFNEKIGDTSSVLPQDINSTSLVITNFLTEFNKGVDGDTKSKISNALINSRNPNEAVSYALGINGVLNSDNPSAINSFKDLPEDAQVVSTRIAALVSSGMGSAEAVSLVRDAWKNTINPKSAERVKELIQTEVNATGSLQDLVDPTAKFVSSTLGHWYSSDPENSKNLPEMRNVYAAYMAKYQDVGLAQSAFEKYLKTTYSKTNMNGTSEYMKHAPESVLAASDNIDIFKKDWYSSIGQIATELGGTRQGNSVVLPDGKVHNISLDALDKNPVDPLTGNVTYYVRQNGKLITDSEGRFRTFSFKTNQTEYVQKRQEIIDNLAKQRNILNDTISETTDSLLSRSGLMKEWQREVWNVKQNLNKVF